MGDFPSGNSEAGCERGLPFLCLVDGFQLQTRGLAHTPPSPPAKPVVALAVLSPRGSEWQRQRGWDCWVQG